jgi:hypothetical protein
MRNPDMVYVLKMEYVSKINIFGLNMMVKSGLDIYFLNSSMRKAFFRPPDLLHKSEDLGLKIQIQY